MVLSRPGVPAILLQYSSVQLYVLLTLQRVGNLLFFDKRDDSQFGEHVHTVFTNNVSAVLSQNFTCIFHLFSLGCSSLLSSSPSLLPSLNFPIPLPYSPSIFPSSDFLTVSETAKEPPQDETGINCPTNLAMEATYINQNFSQQMLVVSLSVSLSVCLLSVCLVSVCLTVCLSTYLSSGYKIV